MTLKTLIGYSLMMKKTLRNHSLVGVKGQLKIKLELNLKVKIENKGCSSFYSCRYIPRLTTELLTQFLLYKFQSVNCHHISHKTS